MENLIISFILGLSVMFFGMTAWLFFRKGGRLPGIVASLMTLLSLQCFVSMWFILEEVYFDDYYWMILTCLDIVAVPFYGLILRELVCSGSLTLRTVMVNIGPFALLAALYCVTGMLIFYWLMIGGAAVFGTTYLIWTHINIKKYNRRLKEQYSFTENINLDWLRKILWFFFVLLAIWIVDTVSVHANMEYFYLTSSMVMWMIIDYFLYKHESVMDSLGAEAADSPENFGEVAPQSDLGARIEHIFAEQQLFLNPNLKIADVAAAVGSNRTYVSAYFNHEAAITFYDYVNRLRVDYACTLLSASDESVKVIAEKSGYNSPQTFIRVFTKFKGISPSDFRGA